MICRHYSIFTVRLQSYIRHHAADVPVNDVEDMSVYSENHSSCGCTVPRPITQNAFRGRASGGEKDVGFLASVVPYQVRQRSKRIISFCVMV